MDTIAAFSIASQRKAASFGFLARKRQSIAWHDGAPAPWSLRWVKVTCEAEVDWAVADFNRITDYRHVRHDCRYDGPHPAEEYRMPHEKAAARVLGLYGHYSTPTTRVRELLQRIPLQRKAAWAKDQSAEYRLDWAMRAFDSVTLLRQTRVDRGYVWRLLLREIAAYRRLREMVDAPDPHPITFVEASKELWRVGADDTITVAP